MPWKCSQLYNHHCHPANGIFDTNILLYILCYRIVGTFRMVQNFVFFTNRLGLALGATKITAKFFMDTALLYCATDLYWWNSLASLPDPKDHYQRNRPWTWCNRGEHSELTILTLYGTLWCPTFTENVILFVRQWLILILPPITKVVTTKKFIQYHTYSNRMHGKIISILKNAHFSCKGGQSLHIRTYENS